MKNAIVFGPLGAGKTTLANMLLDIHRTIVLQADIGTYEYMRIAGAVYPLGEALKLVVDYLKGEKGNRKEYQETGQFFRQLLGEDVWNECAFRKIKNGIFPAVIDDGRQQAEFEYWKKKGFVRIGIIAPADIRAKRLEARDGYCQKDRFDHEVERMAEKLAYECECLIVNDGTLEQLKEKAEMLYYDVLKEKEVSGQAGL